MKILLGAFTCNKLQLLCQLCNNWTSCFVVLLLISIRCSLIAVLELEPSVNVSPKAEQRKAFITEADRNPQS